MTAARVGLALLTGYSVTPSEGERAVAAAEA
jgi:hypothetical protein